MNQAERYTATMVLDSVSPNGLRLSTIHVHMPRIILAEANTHRKFSRNARSTRAVPTSKLIAEVRNNPYVPLKWLKNKPGMQAAEPMDLQDTNDASAMWHCAALEAASAAEWLFAAGLHKQWAGRPLEPYLFVDWLVSSTDWANFMALRDDPGAQPEIELAAQRIRDCLDRSKPTVLRPGEWHLPYIGKEEDWVVAHAYLRANKPFRHCPTDADVQEVLRKISAARCARVSYAPFDGDGSIPAELVRYDRLVGSRPVHASPCEHQGTPDTLVDDKALVPHWANPKLHRNFTGWIQHRALIPFETVSEMPLRRHALEIVS